jgi:ribosomal protein S18 acetylase RimI-like enzyme
MMDSENRVLETFRPFTVPIKISIRFCTRSDLPAIEQLGLFCARRDLLYNTFERMERNEALMLLAQANGMPCGQLWLDLTRRNMDAVGYIWAVRILCCLRNAGIGARLMQAAEETLICRGFEHAELTVEQRNIAARRFYERLGYREAQTGEAPASVRLRVPAGQFLMRKPWLAGVPAGVGPERQSPDWPETDAHRQR